jgi:quercetin dioxygenase-like cupin family protein
MKSYFHVILSVILTILVFTVSANKVHAGDMMPGSADVKILLYNDEIKISEATRAPGTLVPMHTHPKFFGYYIDAAKVKLTAPDGKETVKDIPAGKLLWFPEGTTHALEVLGTANQHVLVVEWK